MNLLFRILYAQKCSSTHHRLAMDALRYLKGPHADEWCRLFLSEIEQYIDGSKAPDKKFRDFRNHVLHVQDNYWGGAVPTAELWYTRLVDCLKQEDWRRAVYSAGVLSHYVSDPFMPLHTGQTEDEGAVHKLVEWGTARAYRDLVATLPAARGIHNWKPPAAENPQDWLAVLIIDGATLANQSYDILIDHYCPKRGHRNAATGMDTQCRETIAHLLGRCIKALSWVLNCAIQEAGVTPPPRRISAATVLSGLSTPVFFLTRRMASREDRKAVRAILEELRQTGRVCHTLPADEQTIRSAHATEILNTSPEQLLQTNVREPGTRYRIATPEEQREKRLKKHRNRNRSRTQQSLPQNSPPPAPESSGPQPSAVSAPTDLAATDSPELSFASIRPPRLSPQDDVVDAPSIGPRTAQRLQAAGIQTVADLLSADPHITADSLNQRWITDELIVRWQQQAQLMCDVGGLRGVDAQLLVAAGIEDVTALAAAKTDQLHQRMEHYAATSQGQRIVRSSRLPDRRTTDEWIRSVQPASRRAA